MVIDQKARQRALDPQQSFIVKAPAGSGKTTLLTQRFLKLLTICQKDPEEVLAITFTKKAASEMKTRVLDMLRLAKHNSKPSGKNEAVSWLLAEQVLAKDRALQWQLLENPNRLKIMTIDAFSASLVNQLPILSRLGGVTQIEPEADGLYREAATEFCCDLNMDKEIKSAITILQQHLDNNKPKLITLLAKLLSIREQWVEVVISGRQTNNLRKVLENSLQDVIEDKLAHIRQYAPCIPELFTLAEIIANRLDTMGSTSCITALRHLKTWPNTFESSKKQWQGLFELLCTKEGVLRKRVNKAQGFLSSHEGKDKTEKETFKQQKQLMENILAQLQEETVFCYLLSELRYLPPSKYEDEQWAIIEALLQSLPYLLAYLQVIFQRHQKIDFTEISLAAIEALTHEDCPTDLALVFDYKIQHILIDEFQDTSILQMRLLEQLTLTWEPNDGRTLFIVGDPMQSIYRFRQADVGLFLKAIHQGIGQIHLESLQLITNFRSSPKIVQTNNIIFDKVFPRDEDSLYGAIPFDHSKAHQEKSASNYCFYAFHSDEEEALEIVKIIQTIRKNSNESIAILVRSRKHLTKILPALKLANIPYEGIEIEQLYERTVVQDLLALAEGLIHLGDRVAWLAILRAPWCGLELADLYHLIEKQNKHAVLWDIIKNTNDLSLHIQKRLYAVRLALEAIIPKVKQESFSQLLFSAWRALQGDKLLTHQKQIDDALLFFDVIKGLENKPLFYQPGYIREIIQSVYAKNTLKEPHAVEVMTIHKAKGLEFDTVILPGLNKKPISESKSLFLWDKYTTSQGSSHLLLAPLAKGKNNSLVYDCLRYFNKKRSLHEAMRLLYVAATRAKKHLYWTCVLVDDQPTTNSLLSYAMHAVADKFEEKHNKTISKKENKCQLLSIQRIPLHQLNLDKVKNDKAIDNVTVAFVKEYHAWEASSFWKKQVGILIHDVFYQIAYLNLDNLDKQWIDENIPFWHHQLKQANVPLAVMSKARELVETAVMNALQDSKSRWILDSTQHQIHYAEWGLSYYRRNQLEHIVIDRAFLDHSDIFWVVDYKTCSNFEATQYQEQHIYQVKKYMHAVSKLYPQYQIKGLLYYPLQQHYRDVALSEEYLPNG